MPQRYDPDQVPPLDVTPPAPASESDRDQGYADAPEYADLDVAGDAAYGPSTVIAALDQIEVLVEGARAVPLSANVVLNRAEILDLVNQARDALPDDLVAADAVVADADAVLSRADDVAEAAVAEAAVKSRTLLDEARLKADTVLSEASDEAKRKVDRANEEAATIKSRAAAEVEALFADANAQVDRLVSTDHITEVAQQRAHDLVMNARRESEALRQGAQSYVSESLGRTSKLLEDLLRRTDAGIRALADRGEVDEAANIDLD